MKNILPIFFAVLIFNHAATSQSGSLEVGLNYNVPSADFAELLLGGAALTLHPRFKLSDKVAVGVNIGANLFVGGDLDDPNAVDAEVAAAGILSILGTIQYKLFDRRVSPYAEVGTGMFYMWMKEVDTSTDGHETVASSYFGFYPKVGLMIGTLNISTAYILAEEIEFVQFGVGFRFGKK